MLSNFSKKTILLFASFIFLISVSLVSAQVTPVQETVVAGQTFNFEDVNASIQGNDYDINDSGFIDTVDKFVFVDYFQSLKAFIEQGNTSDSNMMSLFDLNNDDVVDDADIKICRYFDRKLKKGFGLKTVSLVEAKEAVIAQQFDVNGDRMVNAYDRNIVRDYSKRLAREMRSNTVRNPRSVDNGEPVYYCEEARSLTVLEKRDFVLNGTHTGCDRNNAVTPPAGYTFTASEGIGALCGDCEEGGQIYRTSFQPSGTCLHDCQDNGTGWYEFDGFASFDSEYCCGDCDVIDEENSGLMYYDPNTQAVYENTVAYCSAVNSGDYDLNNDGVLNDADKDLIMDFYRSMKANYGLISVPMSEIKAQILEISADLNNDGVVNATDRYIYRDLYRNLRNYYDMTPSSEGWDANYDFNDDEVVDVMDKRLLRNFYNVLKIQYKYQYASLGEFVYDAANIKIRVNENSHDLNSDGATDNLDLLIYRTYYANLKGVYRESFTPDASSTEPQIWEHINYDLNSDNTINSLDRRALGTYYKAMRLAVRETMNRFRIR